MSLPPRRRYSTEEYLARERAAEYKSEYLNGEIFAMSGASERHNLIVANLVATLYTQFHRSTVVRVVGQIAGYHL